MGKGFKYDGMHSDDLHITLTGKNVPIVPSLVEHFETIAGRDGAWDFGVQYGTRTIELDCIILAVNPQDLKNKLRALAGFFNPRRAARPLIFDDDPTKIYFARLTGQLPLAQIGSLGSFTLHMTCPDPFVYSTNEEIISGTEMIYVTNEGTHYAQPTLIVVHNGGAGKVTLNRSDGKVQELSFASNSPSGTYTINCKEGTIVRNNTGAYKFVTGDFFQLPEGVNTIEKNGGVDNIEVRYRHTWI
ncbi:distal tail protein Dit [Alkaliphilus peptidifermentans]|uniref:Putative phage tail component, N-terminal domain-containing protein n=1 Tax=Alkaliphilus peptidifermentans DSM 18978 TaxID=1120976 RepID=A0A1G5JJR2_9FIRM|nr:distal tail protein Dit [Alkaliphilus peptidifermentans]SCY88566.1 putative phage tail component, N-terminal domain-containing protein [Alkaliphilus peptidifermentans DSM 18978]